MKDLNSCYLCSSDNFFDVEERHVIADMMDCNWSDGIFRVVMCQNCGLVQNVPRPTAEKIARIYENDIMFDSRLRKIEPSKCYYPATPSSYKEQLDFITEFWSLYGRRSLEVGPGDGYFLNLMANSGAKVSGVEPNVEMADFIEKQGFGVINDIFEDTNIEAEFDFVVARHVLEHTLDPMLFLDKAREALTPNGQLYVEVPNVMAVQAHDIESQFPFQHLWSFSLSMLKFMVEKAGFELVVANEFMQPPVIRLIAKVCSKSVDNITIPKIDDSMFDILQHYKKQRQSLIARIIQNIEAFSQKNKGKKILLHGASYHTIELLSLIPEFKFDNILDISSYKQGKLFMGNFIVSHPDDCAVDNIAVIISSALSAEDIKAYWLGRGLNTENILNLYQG